MFEINWCPVRRNAELTLSAQGDALTINGEVFDFTPLPDGDTLLRDGVACEWLASDVERIGDVINLTLILPHGANAPQETKFPQPVTVSADGPVPVPLHNLAEEEAEEEPQEEQEE